MWKLTITLPDIYDKMLLTTFLQEKYDSREAYVLDLIKKDLDWHAQVRLDNQIMEGLTIALDELTPEWREDWMESLKRQCSEGE